MIPALTDGGHSFRGAASYYLHDKRPPGRVLPTARQTAVRVAWTEVLNLPTSDPERAWRMMVHTAKSQGALKAVAGIKSSGRKLEKPVFAYSLAWHPDEQPTRQEMLEAAHESLKALGLEDHQAIIAAHADEPHPHLHIIVNRVDPMTGVAARLSKSMLKLSAWAQGYEERRGRVFCAERVENNARRAGLRPGRAADNRSRRLNRAEYEAAAVRRADTAALRRDFAERFTAQAATERQNAQARAEALLQLARIRRDVQTAARDRHRAANDRRRSPDAARRGEDLAAQLMSGNPALSLTALTDRESTFTRAQLARLVGRHTADDAVFQAVRDRLLASPELVRLGRDAAGRERFTTREMRAVERRMEDHALTLFGLRRAGGPVAASWTGHALSDEQERALRHVLASPALAAVSGFAGTGKSTMLDAARQSWQAAGHRVIGAALSGIAADGLQAGAGIDSSTIHARLYQWDRGQNLLTANDVVVIDEAGMIGSRLMERLLAFARRAGAKIVLVGEAEQLQAIDAGAAFRAITDRVGAARLETVRRQKNAWQRDATRELATARTRDALTRYDEGGMIRAHATEADAALSIIAAWDEHRRLKPNSSQIILAYTRQDVRRLNELARAAMRSGSTLGPDHEIATAVGLRRFAAGDRLYFLKNDARLGVRNGSLGTVERISGTRMTVRLDGGGQISIDILEYAYIDHGYAATIHKSQGVTVDRAHLLASRNLDRHSVYVAMTRHRDRLDLHWSKDRFASRDELARRLSRRAAKDTSLDYGAAENREARRQAAEDMRARIARRGAAFAARETTQAGRLANARSLAGTSASLRDVAQLATKARLREAAFRRQQAKLARWAQQVESATKPPAAFPALAKHDPIDRLMTARETLAMVDSALRSHSIARAAERSTRRLLSAEAARSWATPASRVSAGFASRAFNSARQGDMGLGQQPGPAVIPPRKLNVI